ncbi:MAG: DNA polymerase III subunit [Labilithrix sp.]|nr:DNA polymerase III subunit [Labilithrix sp.]MCW5814681.1 DNA polymerase III subunit [Labilithrix sp.]
MTDLLANVRAQETALRTIDFALESDRVHHAYLFAGPNGVGKELAAFGLAQALVCERRGGDEGGGLFAAAAPEPKRVRACGACSACQRAVPREDTRPLHPDVVVIERGLYAPSSIGRRTPETQDISVDQIRTLVLARAAFAPHEGRAKVFIVRRAEELSDSAANALLKTLEEPGQKTHFILLTSQPEALLPTILSRTQRVRFAPLPDDVVQALLVEGGVEAARAAEVARLAGGSVEAGVLLADPDESEARDRFVADALAATTSPGIEPVLALAEAAKKDKDRLPAHIAALASKLAANAAESARAGRTDAEAIATRGRHALTALEHLSGNGAAQLVVEAMLTRMRAT